MKFYFSRTAVSIVALSCSAIAHAGDEPLYEPAPEWIAPVDRSQIEPELSNTQIVSDTQIRIEEGLHWNYSDLIYRVGSLSDLSNMGTLTAQWLPDKGDLIVHEISIQRDGETIDLVEQGEVMEVLRREQQLEQRILDGSLTATLAVPGLEVGDELRMRFSVTTSDQALGDDVQSISYLYREPQKFADYARILASWPDDLDVRYKAGPNYELSSVTQQGGYNWLEVKLPLEEAEDMPFDAPLRYRRGTLLEMGTFEDWAEVSSIMAPYYETGGQLDELDDLKAEIEEIRTGYATDLERAVAALELVQEDIRYLLNGLDGGNYLPQDVATTWDKKYGDCKAKTLILLAMLHDLGIEAEPVLASISAGGAVPISLPIPGAFDHVLVRARIDGQEYYLDGTSLGANIKVVGNVPPFEYVLPIKAAGAELEPIEQVLPRYPDVKMALSVDASAGVDLPGLATMEMTFVGPSGANLNAQADKLTDERRRQMGQRSARGMSVIDVEIVKGNDDSEASLIVTGIADPVFEFDGTRAEMKLSTMASGLTFAPDRSRPDWRDLPVAIGQANAAEISMRALLPQDGTFYEFRGAPKIDTQVAGSQYIFDAVLQDGGINVTETRISRGGEIAPDDFRAERRAAAILAREQTKLVADQGLQRRWRYAQQSDRSALEPLENAFARLIADDPEEANSYLKRAAFRYDTFDFAGALADMNKVLELEPTAAYYGQRSSVHAKLLDQDASVADLQEAYALDPTAWRGIYLARELVNAGRLEEARDIAEYEDGDEQVRRELEYILAEIDALSGDTATGLLRFDDLLADDPNTSELLNNKCWYMATWNLDPEEGLSVCTRAVENSGKAASILDSRAMMFLRSGQLDAALSDIEAGLNLNPGLSESVLLRGLIRIEQGDEGGRADIRDALARAPDLAATYRRWGFDI